MLTPLLLATEILLHQSTADVPTVAVQKQDAVLVVRDGIASNGDELVTVTTPIAGGASSLWSLAELRESARKTQASIDRPAVAFTVDRTIGGRPKHAKDGGGEGGIAGEPEPSEMDLIFDVTSSSVIPGSILVEFNAALEAIEKYFESQLYNPVTVRLRLAYVQLSPGRLGVTSCRYAVKTVPETFTAINLIDDPAGNDGDDVQSTPVSTTMPVRYSGINISVTPENRVYVTQALQKALGIYEASGIGGLYHDGVITLNNTIQWDRDPSNGLLHGTSFLYSFQDALVREIMQLLGNVAGADFLVRDCTVMDFYRFQRDVISTALVVADPDDILPGPPPPATCPDVEAASLAQLEAGSHLSGHALDYNPGLNKSTIAAAGALVPPVTPGQLMNLVGGPPPQLLLINQMRGLLDFDNNPLPPQLGNTFDDARLPTDEPSEITAYPDGATQTVVRIVGHVECAFVDFRQGEYTFGGLLTPVNFLGACPRLVARDSPANGSTLNFLQNTARDPDDFELAMYDGSPVRGCFIIQNENAELSTRCLMGKELQKGVTWYSRDPAADPPYSVHLGSLPDYLTRRELLILDTLGWAINVAGDRAADLTAE